MMKFIPTALEGVVVIEPKVFEDPRGFFFEFYHQKDFAGYGIATRFVQDNHSRSDKGVLRGLHYQVEPFAQAKLVRVVRGEAFDVAVDIRPGSPTFGRHVSVLLNEANKKLLYIPEGFAHGFCALADGTEFQYKVSNFYSPAHERGLFWKDPDIGIPWPDLGMAFILSPKDQTYPRLREIEGKK